MLSVVFSEGFRRLPIEGKTEPKAKTACQDHVPEKAAARKPPPPGGKRRQS